MQQFRGNRRAQCRVRCRHSSAAAAAAKSLQSCLTLCNPIDSSPPGSPVPGILQARTLEWVAISFSNAWKWKVKVKSLSRVRLFTTPWTAAYQAPLSMGFSRQEYWSGVPSPSLAQLCRALQRPRSPSGQFLLLQEHCRALRGGARQPDLWPECHSNFLGRVQLLKSRRDRKETMSETI